MVMGFEFLFDNDFPSGVKSVFVNGKKYTKNEFLEIKKQKKLNVKEIKIDI
jgi:hypothetical protein